MNYLLKSILFIIQFEIFIFYLTQSSMLDSSLEQRKPSIVNSSYKSRVIKPLLCLFVKRKFAAKFSHFNLFSYQLQRLMKNS
jgi:hypothetical protein